MVEEVSSELEYNSGRLLKAEDVAKKALQVGKVVKVIERNVVKTLLSVKVNPIKTVQIKSNGHWMIFQKNG